MISQLFEVFGNPAGVQKVIESVIPDKSKLDEHRKDLARIEIELAQIADRRSAILKKLVDSKITDSECDKALDQQRLRATELEDERERLISAIGNAPSAEAVGEVAADFEKMFRRIHWKVAAKKGYANDLDNMSWEDKRALVEQVFAGKSIDGSRHGVYVAELGKGIWRYEVRGILPSLFEPISKVVNRRKGVTSSRSPRDR